jgi:hypothetical protein
MWETATRDKDREEEVFTEAICKAAKGPEFGGSTLTGDSSAIA